jgi:hypothetical protein
MRERGVKKNLEGGYYEHCGGAYQQTLQNGRLRLPSSKKLQRKHQLSKLSREM